MKKIIIVIAAILALSDFAAAQKYYNKVKLATAEDSVSYCVGILMAKNFAEQGFDMFSADAIGKAFSDIANNKTLAIPSDDMSAMVSTYFSRIEAQQKEKAQAKEKEFFANNAKEDGIITTESGLQYRVIKEGTGRTPDDTCGVKVHYEGKLLDGTVFDSTFDTEEPVQLNLDYLIPGMTEGLKLMKEGAEYMFYIPSDLAYGEYSPASVIPAYSTLIFDIELVQVTEHQAEDDEDDDSPSINFDMFDTDGDE